ncbi:hypothetical protein [Luteolibacter sp. Populi]|uniref:hypothetical protein n=1 Tax=Luteolibacter sp. Populi TaxID=3230487 RepID=UPI003466D1A2
MPRPAAISGYCFAFLILSTLTWTVWQYRFTPPPDMPALTLDYTPPEVMRVASGNLEGEGAELHFGVEADGVRQRLEYLWRGHPRTNYAHIAVDASCRDVEAGKMLWEDARIVLLWIDADGKMAPDYLPIWTGRGGKERKMRDFVMPLARSGTLAKIAFENSGRSGVMTVHSFTVQPVEYRTGMHWIIAGLTLAWVGWAGWGLRQWFSDPGAGALRIAAAATLWVLFAWLSSLPGPWVPWKPITQHFPIPTILPPPMPSTPPVPDTAPVESTPPAVVASPPVAPRVTPPVAPPVVSPTAPPVVAVPAATPVPPPQPQPRPSAEEGAPEGVGGPVRWFLIHLTGLKRTVHLLAFAGLTAMMALLAGSKRVMWPVLALGALSEFFQWVFGFGFSITDVLDLVLDTAAVLAGVTVWQWLMKQVQKRSAGHPSVPEG